MIAPVIIVASKGNSEPAWLATSSARPCDGHVVDALGLDPPPDVVEELEEREDRLGELLVEAPLVLVVLALQARTIASIASRSRARQRLGRLLGGGQRVEARLDPAAELAQEVGDRLGRRASAAMPRAHRPIPVEARRRARRRCSAGPTRRPSVLAAKSRTAPTASKRGSIAELLAQAPVVDAAPEAQQRAPRRREAAGAEPAAEPCDAGAEQRVRDRQRRAAAAAAGSGSARSRRRARR